MLPPEIDIKGGVSLSPIDKGYCYAPLASFTEDDMLISLLHIFAYYFSKENVL